MINKIICNLLLVIFGISPFVSYAGGETPDKDNYFILHVNEDVEEARVCDLYVRDNSKWIIHEMEGLENLYKNKYFSDIEKYINNKKLQEYEKNLSTCTTYFRYENEPNYFREAHSKLLLIIAIVEITVSTKKYNDSMNDLIKGFKSSIVGIMESERVTRNIE